MAQDVNISFNLSISLEQALELLRCINSNAFSTKKAKATDCQSDRIDKKANSSGTFKGLSVSTLEKVLDVLSSHFDDRFTSGQAIALTKSELGLSRTPCQVAVTYALERKKLFKIKQGIYSFKQSAPAYKPATESLVDIVLTKDPDRLVSAFRMMSKVSERAALYFNENGISARFNNRERNAMVDLSIDRTEFESYHVEGHVKLVVSCSAMLKILSKVKGPVHLQVTTTSGRFKVGALEDEHEQEIIECEKSVEPFPVEQPMPPFKSLADTTVSKVQLDEILSNVKSHTNDVRIRCKNGSIEFESNSPHPEYHKQVEAVCFEEFTATYSISDLLRCLNGRGRIGDSNLKLSLKKELMLLRLISDERFRLDYYLTPYLEAVAPTAS